VVDVEAVADAVAALADLLLSWVVGEGVLTPLDDDVIDTLRRERLAAALGSSPRR
jgi:hypothetical protein